MACQVLLEVGVVDGRYDDLKNKFVEILPDTRSFDGNISIYITRNQDDPAKLVIIELWETRGHYEKYLEWRTQRGDMDMLGEMMENPSWRFLDNIGV
jgi:quinol monooxygenase YgiN